MSPEQLQGHPVDRRSDVYSASVVLYEALVGGKLFDGNSEGVLVGNILAGVKAPPSQKISLAKTIDQKTFQALQALDAVVLRGLARDPAARFATAREMAIALEEATKVASVDAVEEWVGRMSGPMLASRAEIVRRIESDPTRSLTPARSATMITPTPALGSSPQAMTYPTSTSSSGREEQSLVQPVRSRFGRWIAIALVTSTPTVLLASYAVWRVSHPPPPAASVAVAASPPPSAAAPAPSASPPPAPSAAPAAVAAVAPSASPSPPSTGAPSAAPAPAPPAEAAEEAPRPAPHAKHHAKDTPKPAKAAVDCDPPYTLDQGVRIPKPECL
jgi:serine/threonine-protein kinase